MANPHCYKCFGTGKRHNGYFEYPCNCTFKPILDFEKINSDINIIPKPVKVFEISPFTLTEIQYLRSLIVSDKKENDYENQGMNAKIDQNTSMYEFTNKILEKLDEFEKGLGTQDIQKVNP